LVADIAFDYSQINETGAERLVANRRVDDDSPWRSESNLILTARGKIVGLLGMICSATSENALYPSGGYVRRRIAEARVRRETPLKIRLMPMIVPMNHRALLGH
jgi:hypothetical protein